MTTKGRTEGELSSVFDSANISLVVVVEVIISDCIAHACKIELWQAAAPAYLPTLTSCLCKIEIIMSKGSWLELQICNVATPLAEKPSLACRVCPSVRLPFILLRCLNRKNWRVETDQNQIRVCSHTRG